MGCRYVERRHDRDRPPVPQAQKYAAIIAVSARYNCYRAMRRKKEMAHYDIACETKVWDFHGPVPPPG
jgi:hypothetical protein